MTNTPIQLLDERTHRIRPYHTEQMEPLFADRKDYPSYHTFKTKYSQKMKEGLTRIEQEYNTSWYHVLKMRWSGKEAEEALFYRGNSIPGSEIFSKADLVAASLRAAGIKKGDEIACCVGNIPELIYLLLGANKIGAILNFYGAAFAGEYQDIILNSVTPKITFISDEVYDNLEGRLDASPIQKRVILSLADSLPEHPERCDGYEPELSRFYHYKNHAEEVSASRDDAITFAEFLALGSEVTAEEDPDLHLDTEFLITYTSGSTKVGYPKRMIHKNRGLITDGTFHDPDLCSNPAIPNFRCMSHIHTDTATTIISVISNALMQQWSLALEPEYGRDIFLDYLFLNKPNYVCATTSFFLEAAREYLIEKRYHDARGKGRPLDFLLIPFAVGEGCQPGEEEFINQFLKKSKAGSGVKVKGPIRLPYTTLGVAGGDTEHGGIFYKVMKATQAKLNRVKLHGKEMGMECLPFVQATVLVKQDDGTFREGKYNEYGIIVANSPLTMAGYKNWEKTRAKILVDERSNEWVSCDVFGYIDRMGGIHMKDRRDNKVVLEDGRKVLPFQLIDVAEKDPKNLMTCMVTTCQREGKLFFIVNYDVSPLRKKSEEEILSSLLHRMESAFPDLTDRILYRQFSPENPFPVTPSGKRSMVDVEKLGDNNAFHYVS